MVSKLKLNDVFMVLESPEFLGQYLPIVIFFVVAGGLSVVMLLAGFVLSKSKPDPEKNSAYECGFPPFEDTRNQFDVRFYLVAILFTLFDLEIALLFPYAVAMGYVGWFGYAAIMSFLVILTVGFIYEWRKGALEWE